MKKLLSILLTFIMVFSFVGMSASAAEETKKGSIVVNNYNENVTITIYRMMDLADYDAVAGTYPYVINSEWKDFFETGKGADYISVDPSSKAITWKGAESEERIAEFAKEALKYATDATTSVQAVKIVNKDTTDTDIKFNSEKTSVTFENIPLGYYLVDSTMGALCGLTTTNPDGVINAKNGIPTVDKQVQEDLTGSWGETNTADIGQTVAFRVTINVHAGAQNYIIHDDMGGKFNFGSITALEHITSTGTVIYKPEDATYKLSDVVSVDAAEGKTKPVGGYTASTNEFHIVFTEEFCENLKTNDRVIVYYDGMLNGEAVVGEKNVDDNQDGNKNTAKLHFGEGQISNEDHTITYTFGIDLVKTDHNNTLLDGAEFRIYDAPTGGNEVKVVLKNDGVTYRKARSDESGINIVVKKGKARIDGLDNGTYYLQEEVAPATYNKLETRQAFTISDKDLDATFTGEIYSKGSGVQVINKTGVMLPETGGMGTTLFVSLGAIVVLGTGVLLVTKKRMSMIDD